jgi:hypothetical protein
VAIDDHEVIAVPDKAGDRVKMEEQNQNKPNDGALLQAAQQQDGRAT